jgi:hypothetical protein
MCRGDSVGELYRSYLESRPYNGMNYGRFILFLSVLIFIGKGNKNGIVYPNRVNVF